MAFGFTWLTVSPMLLVRAAVIRGILSVENIQIIRALAGPTVAALIIDGSRQGLRFSVRCGE